MKGTVKRIVSDKGFGFINDGGNKEYFFHRTGLLNCKFEDLREGDQVTFELEESTKGPRACDVQR